MCVFLFIRQPPIQFIIISPTHTHKTPNQTKKQAGWMGSREQVLEWNNTICKEPFLDGWG